MGVALLDVLRLVAETLRGVCFGAFGVVGSGSGSIVYVPALFQHADQLHSSSTRCVTKRGQGDTQSAGMLIFLPSCLSKLAHPRQQHWWRGDDAHERYGIEEMCSGVVCTP